MDTYVTSLQIGYFFFGTYRDQEVRVLFRVLLFQHLQRTKRSCSISGTYFSAPTKNNTFVFYFGYFYFSTYREQNIRVLFRTLLFQHLQRTRRSCSISKLYQKISCKHMVATALLARWGDKAYQEFLALQGVRYEFYNRKHFISFCKLYSAMYKCDNQMRS
jgi:hypothetical protein